MLDRNTGSAAPVRSASVRGRVSYRRMTQAPVKQQLAMHLDKVCLRTAKLRSMKREGGR